MKGNCRLCGRFQDVLITGLCSRDKKMSRRGMTDEQILEIITNPGYTGKGGRNKIKILSETIKGGASNEMEHKFVELKEGTGMKIGEELTAGTVITTGYPKRIPLIVWGCSDGREWGTEIEAYRHELDITRERLLKVQRRA